MDFIAAAEGQNRQLEQSEDRLLQGWRVTLAIPARIVAIATASAVPQATRLIV